MGEVLILQARNVLTVLFKNVISFVQSKKLISFVNLKCKLSLETSP